MQTNPLVAPTQKISDDAPYPQSGPQAPPQHVGGYQSGPASIPPGSYAGPTSVPPQNYNPASIPPQNNPASIPPQNYNPASIPPQNIPTPAPGQMRAPSQPAYNPASVPPQNNPSTIPPGASAPPRAVSRPPTATPNGTPSISRRAPRPRDASLAESLPPPRRRWGLIIAVLLVDLALAGAGVYLLREGLA